MEDVWLCHVKIEKKNEKYISTTIQPTTSVWLGHNSKVK